MTASKEFIAAKHSPLIERIARSIMPLALPRVGVIGVDYDRADLDRLRALDGERVLLTPNHPTNTEPALLFHLSCAVRKPFFYLACREAFDPFFGLWGEFIRRIGAFSVVRGTVDRASFRATREILAKPGTHLVVFPEGEVYSQNDTLLPFHSGVFQLAFWALEDIHKSAEPDVPLFILPVSIKYHYIADMRSQIAASLARLERFTGATTTAAEESYARLRAIGSAMLRSLEKEYRLPSPKEGSPEVSLTPRLDAIKEAILQRVAAAAGVALPKGDTLPERMRALIHVIEMVTREEPQALTPYDTELRHNQRERAQPLLRDLERLANWIAVYDGYVAADPSPERMIDTLTRLERECWGRSYIKGPRRCRVRLGDAINLQDCWSAYEGGRRAEVARVTREVEGRVGAGLTYGDVPSTAGS